MLALDEIGADVDPFLGRHIVNELLRTDAQVLVASRSPQVVDAFNSDEIVRLYWADGSRRAARGRDLSARTDRFALRFRASQLSPALSARAAVVVDGYHDRLSLTALTERAYRLGKMPSYAAAGITFVDADGTGGLRGLALAAHEFGIYTIVLADNDLPAGTAVPAELTDVVNVSDAVVRLPPRTALERLLLAEIPDDELRRVALLLIAQFSRVTAPANIATATGTSLRNAVLGMLKQPGQLHVSFVQAVDEQWLCPAAVRVLTAIHEAARAGAPRGLLGLRSLDSDDVAAAMSPPDVEA